MPLADLDGTERDLLFRCMTLAASGEIFPDDEEFPTIFGIEAAELRAIVAAWPDIDESREDVRLAINNSLNNLLGYPHQSRSDLPASHEEIARVLQKWRGSSITNYSDGIL